MATCQDVKELPQLQHVVAVPLPAPGHIKPLLRFCQMLVKHPGFTVTFVDFDSFHAGTPQDQLPLHDHHHHHPNRTAEAAADDDGAPSGVHAPLIRRASIPIDGLNFSDNFNVSFTEFFGAMPSMAPYLEQLIISLNRQGPPVTCLLSDYCVTLPTQDVADKLAIPRIVLYTFSASQLLFTHYVSKGEDSCISIQGVLEALAIAPTKRGEVFTHGLPGLPTLFYEDIPHFRHVMDDTLYLWGNFKESWQICDARAHAIAVNSFMDLEKPTFHALMEASNVPIYDVGFWKEPLSKESATSLWKEDTSCMSWLDKQLTASVLYISFGSITILSISQLEEFEYGLISSEQKFLWSFRADLVHEIDYSSHVASLMSRSDGKGFVVSWAPQLEVLSHPSVGGFLTHCGWNSTTESIASGVPMLCWPYFADQPLNARCIEDVWRVGLGFKACTEESNGIVERDEVEKAIRALMEGEEGRGLRLHAAHLKEKSHESSLESGSSTTKTKALVKSLLHYSSSSTL